MGGNETTEAHLKTDQLVKGAVLKVSDPKIYDPVSGFNSGWRKDMHIRSTTNGIELFLDTESPDIGSRSFDVQVDLKLSYKDASDKVVQNNQGKDTTRISLSVDYSPSGEYKVRDIHAFQDAHQVHVEITDVAFNGADTTALTNAVYLRSFISVERYYKMKNTRVQQLKDTYNRQDNELNVSWKEKEGAVWYDVEWTFVNNYDVVQGNMQRKSKSDLRFDFDKNSQRIRTKKNSYAIPIVYAEGYLVYRVRPLTIAGANFEKKKPGPWSNGSSGKVSSAANVFVVGPSIAMEKDNINWQYQATYTERGNKKALVKFFDGLYYKRQTVKQLHSENNVLVNEYYYDFNGRQALDVLPSPRAVSNLHPSLQYYDAFNQNRQGQGYNKSNFDNFSACGPAADPMSNTSGAAKYYSSNNSSNNRFKDFLPRSEGYPFKQTQFMPDKTGDVRSIGKPGKKHQIGQGHAVKKFNGTPSQDELDRLFGSEVGKAGNYRKRMVVNENGQVRVQYLNEKGDPVASALAGDTPPALEELPDSQKESKTNTDDILSAHQVKRGNSLESSYKILVPTEGNQYSFNYTVDPSTFSRYVCEGESICYDGLYNLRIMITNDCGDVVKDTSMQIGDIQQIDEKCNDNKKVTLSFSSGPLSIGSYYVSKKLELNEQALEKYLALFEQKSCIQAKYDTIYKENREKMDTINCDVGCGEGSVIKKSYEYTTEDGEVRKDDLSDAEYQRLKEQQSNLCGSGTNMCAGNYDVLLGDVSPGGQYALFYDSINDETNPDKFPLSVLNDNSNHLPKKNAHWRNPASPYRDREGNIHYININRIDGVNGVLDTSKITIRGQDSLIKPQNILKVSDFIGQWRNSWAQSLLPYHPEYGYYQYCSQYTASNQYDGYLMGTGKYEMAIDSGYISSSGATNLLQNDPFFSSNSQLKTKMQDTLNNFVSRQGQTFSLAEIVIAMHNGCAPVKCATGNINLSKMKTCINNNKPLFKNKDQTTRHKEWNAYKSIYLALKRKLRSPERHQYAINRGYYNGCIGVESDYRASRGSDIFKDDPYQNSSNFKKGRSCFSNTSHYADKDIRFADGDDIYKYVDGFEKMENIDDQLEEAENYVDNRMKNNCDKCPVETDLETLLNGLTIDNSITSNQDATSAVTSCDIKNQMNAGNNSYFNWQVTISGRELTGKLVGKSNGVTYQTIKLYDSSKRQLDWNNIVLFTCLQHTSSSNHYNATQKRNFKVRAVTNNNEPFWLEGLVSSFDLTDCDVEKFCTKNEVAEEVKSIFNLMYGMGPVLRQFYIDNGYQYIADSMMPSYSNTNYLSDVALNTLSDRMKAQHKYPNSFNYYWIVDTITDGGSKMQAGIYEAKKNTSCSFDFEMLDAARQFGQPFIVTKIHLNHPAILQNNCDANEFVLEVRPVVFNQDNNWIASGDQNLLNRMDYGKPYFIKVSSECYSVGECCPESKCPDIAINGDFEKGNTQFSSDLSYSAEEQGANFYKIYPKAGSGFSGINIDDIMGGNLQGIDNPNISPGLMNTGDDAQEGNEGGELPVNTGGFNPGELEGLNNLPDSTLINSGIGSQMMEINRLMNRSDDMLELMNQMMESQNQTQQSILNNMGGEPSSGELQTDNFFIPQPDTLTGENLLDQEGFSGATFTPEQLENFNNRLLQQGLNFMRNKYLVFKVADMNQHQVWKQNLNLKNDRTYGFSLRLKPMLNNQPISVDQFKLVAGNQEKSLEFKEAADGWNVYKTYFTTNQSGSTQIALQFKASSHNPNLGYQKWAIDNIVIKPQSCRQVACCPPLTPSVPDDAIEDPCKTKKEMIAKANTEREFEQFLNDTLSSIEAGYRKVILTPDESLTMNYAKTLYDHTLFYYDQSGNLVKTVPPKGFTPLANNQIDQVQQNRAQGGGNPVYPAHKRQTTYKFNSYDEIIYMKSPDEGVTKYWYDELGRMVAEQTAAQAKDGNVYTYYLYDELNRKIQSGQLKAASSLKRSTARDYNKFENWVRTNSRTEVVHKYFDKAISGNVNSYFPDGQQNLRKRPASIIYEEDWDRNKSTYDFATHFSYDPHGKVSYLVKENNHFPTAQQVKKVDYDFDVINGNITKIVYQPGQKDQFIHKYKYDEDNRLAKVLTSRYGIRWEEEAKYYYYPHGKTARVELGEEKVQGVDYAYTIQGWLKGINGSELKPQKDAGKDGVAQGIFSNVAKDAVSVVLDYHSGDYKSVGGTNLFTSHLNGPLNNSSSDLYSEDVRQMVVNNAAFDNQEGVATAYTYDHDSRLAGSKVFLSNAGNWQATSDYETSFGYDANGNLTSLSRKGDNGAMDNLTYNYGQGNNRLKYVSDQVAQGAYPNDIDDQKPDNYTYDAQGRMIRDLSEGLNNIEWSRHDKVKHAVKVGFGDVYNHYDGSGFRVMKEYYRAENSKDKAVSYVRGLNNEILAKYKYVPVEDSTYLTEHYIHGRKRIGTYDFDSTMKSVETDRIAQYRGKKQYEISNHLGNVLVTLSDRKLVDTTSAGPAKSYRPDIASATGYYPYGSQLPGRKKQTDKYEFGFQGKEKDGELKGEGNAYYFKERMYDPRLGKWLSVDPKATKYPGKSPYMAMSGNPVSRADNTGGEDHPSCSVEWSRAMAHDQEMMHATKNSDANAATYGDAYAVNTGNTIYTYKSIDQSDLDNLAQINPLFDESVNNELYKSLPSKKIRMKTQISKGKDGKHKISFSVSVYNPSPDGQGGIWQPVSATPKGFELSERIRQGNLNKDHAYIDRYGTARIETGRMKRSRMLIQAFEIGSDKLTNLGGSFGALYAAYRGDDMEGMIQDMKTGAALWDMVGAGVGTYHRAPKINSGPDASERPAEWKSTRGAGVK